MRSTAFWNSGVERRSAGTEASIASDLALQSRSYSYQWRKRSASVFTADSMTNPGCAKRSRQTR
jgi:hypothetical protein